MKLRDYLWMAAVVTVLLGWSIDAYMLHMAQIRYCARWKREYQERMERTLTTINRLQMLYDRELARQAMEDGLRVKQGRD